MRIIKLGTLLILAAGFIIGLLLVSSCDTGATGESFVDIPDGPKQIFRGGYGNIVIKYQPPPEPIFKVDNATRYLDFNQLQQKFGIVEQPLVVAYNVKSSVISASIESNTLEPGFDSEVLAVIKSWIYSRWGFGRMKIKVEMSRSRITVDRRGISLADAVPGQSIPTFGELKEMVASYGFNKVIEGNL